MPLGHPSHREERCARIVSRQKLQQAIHLRLDTALGEWRDIGAYDDPSVARIAPFDAVELEVGRLFPPAGAV